MKKPKAYPKQCTCFGKDEKLPERVPKRFRGPWARKSSFIFWHMRREHGA